MCLPLELHELRELLPGGFSVGAEGNQFRVVCRQGRLERRFLPLDVSDALLEPAQALFERGYVPSYDQAFDALLAKDSPAYVPRVGHIPIEAVTLV